MSGVSESAVPGRGVLFPLPLYAELLRLRSAEVMGLCSGAGHLGEDDRGVERIWLALGDGICLV